MKKENPCGHGCDRSPPQTDKESKVCLRGIFFVGENFRTFLR